jgi:hypothetical protein
MFYNNINCTKVSDKIYVFKNIIPKDIIDEVNKDLFTYKRDPHNLWSSNNWYEDKIVPPMKSTYLLWKFMSDLLYPEIVIHPCQRYMVSEPGDKGMFVHADSPGMGKEDEIFEIDVWSACCSLQYGVCAYFGNFTGGEIYYPNINPDGTIKNGTDLSKERLEEPCLVISPEPGDIIIHGACKPYDHGTKPTYSGNRFVFSNFALNSEDNPGTFYNYKSPEWYNQIGKYEDPTLQQINEWASPLKVNPKFAEVIEEKIKAQDKQDLVLDFEK